MVNIRVYIHTYLRVKTFLLFLGKHTHIGKQSHRFGKARERAFGNRVPGFRLLGGSASSSGIRRGCVRELRRGERSESG